MDRKKYVIVDVFYQNNTVFKGYICEVNTPDNVSTGKQLPEDDKYVALYEILRTDVERNGLKTIMKMLLQN